MRNRLLLMFSQYLGLFIALLFAFGLGVIYAVLKPTDVIINGIIVINLVGWIIYIVKFTWDILDKRKIKADDGEIDIVIEQPKLND